MHLQLNRNLFFVKEHTGIFKAANNYDILDPETNEIIFECRELNLGFFTKILRFTKYKKNTPFNILIADTKGETVLRIKRGIKFFRSTIDISDKNEELIGRFKQKFFSFGGKFEVQNADGEVECLLKGNWKQWDYKFSREDVELATVSKKWMGLGKELFTTADNYMLQIDAKVGKNDPVRRLIVAAVMCIDMVFHE